MTGICFQLAQYLLLGITGPTFQVVHGGLFINLDAKKPYYYEMPKDTQAIVEVKCPKIVKPNP